MITVLVVYSASAVFTTNGFAHRSTLRDVVLDDLGAELLAPARASRAIRSGPMMPSRCPGKFSTSVVSIS